MSKAKYVEEIKRIKNTYVSANIFIHTINEDTDLTTLSEASYNMNIDNYISNNIPEYLNDKYQLIKTKLNENK